MSRAAEAFTVDAPTVPATGRLLALLPPVLAALYPLPLLAFHRLVGNGSAPRSWGQDLLAALSLGLAFAVPLLAWLVFARLSALARPSRAQLLARRVAMLAIASPPLFTLVGVICFLAGVAWLDAWLLGAFWLGAAFVIARSDHDAPAPAPQAPLHGRWRMSHGAVALAFITLFLSLHLGNHLTALLSTETHMAVMKVLRLFYRAALVEPLVIAAACFLIVSGLAMAWRWSALPSDRFRAFQLASGVYLAVAITSHVNAVLYLARVHLGIESDWNFGIGAPAGLIHDAWNIRLLPYYALAVFAVVAHAFAGLRIVLLGHGCSRRTADAVVLWGGALGLLLALAISQAMCGLRLDFSGR